MLLVLKNRYIYCNLKKSHIFSKKKTKNKFFGTESEFKNCIMEKKIVKENLRIAITTNIEQMIERALDAENNNNNNTRLAISARI